MKNIKIYLTILILIVTTAIASAQTLRRAGFTATTARLANVDYPDLQAAHDAASPGDTIQVYPNTTPRSYSATFTKRIVLIGPGYLYNTYNTTQSEIPNAGLQSLVGGIGSVSVTLSSGSSGTSFYGVIGLNLGVNSATSDSINNIIVSRSNARIGVSSNSNVLNNWLITQCYSVSIIQAGPSNASFSGNRSLTNWRIENCILLQTTNVGDQISLFQSPVGISSLLFLNCTFIGTQSFLSNQSVVFQNCILDFGSNIQGTANTIFINNITNTIRLNNPIFTNPGSTGNIFDVNIAGTGNVVFVGFPNNTSGSTILNSPDARFKLTTSGVNPARNAGFIPGTTTPTDCGAYGGTNPYRESGIPAIPAFYRLNSPSPTATGNSYPVTFSIRSNN